MKEFWNRWHITLSRFFVTYVYIPLGGGRKGTKIKLINSMIVFLLSGLWHGASWNYVMWGFLNGLGVMFNNLDLFKKTRKEEIKEIENNKFINKVKHFLCWLCTFGYFLFTLIFFRCESTN